MPSFQYLPFRDNHAETDLYSNVTLLRTLVREHHEQLGTTPSEARQKQLDLIDRTLDRLIFVFRDISDALKSQIMTGLLLKIYEEIENEYQEFVLNKLANLTGMDRKGWTLSPDRSILHKSIYATIGVTEANPLSPLEKIHAIEFYENRNESLDEEYKKIVKGLQESLLPEVLAASEEVIDEWADSENIITQINHLTLQPPKVKNEVISLVPQTTFQRLTGYFGSFSFFSAPDKKETQTPTAAIAEAPTSSAPAVEIEEPTRASPTPLRRSPSPMGGM